MNYIYGDILIGGIFTSASCAVLYLPEKLMLIVVFRDTSFKGLQRGFRNRINTGRFQNADYAKMAIPIVVVPVTLSAILYLIF